MIPPRRLALFAALALMAACANGPQPAEDDTSPGEAAASAVDQTRDGLADAAMSPLEDLNLKREPIPEQLKSLSTPYFTAQSMTCDQIARTVASLDRDLGQDWDAPAENADEDGGVADWAADRSASATLGAVASQARGFIPFRGLVREATGAEAHAARVQKAFRIGAERRAFLKGVGAAKGCLPPAAPWPEDPTSRTIVYRTHTNGN